MTKLLYPIRQNHRALARVAPHSPRYLDGDGDGDDDEIEPIANNVNIDDYGKLLVMINCTHKASLRVKCFYLFVNLRSCSVNDEFFDIMHKHIMAMRYSKRRWQH